MLLSLLLMVVFRFYIKLYILLNNLYIYKYNLIVLVLRQSYCIALAKPRIQFADQADLEFRLLPLLLLGLKVCYIDL